jgi:hypothetical protein
MKSSENPQFELELQQEKGKRDGSNDDGDAAIDDDDRLASKDPCSRKDDALCKFSLQIPSGSEVSAIIGVSECGISDSSSCGENI